ncbi:hypothetical protein [Nostoc sp. TCL26-01]|nr:hypothetical protein [Nostoc sp. TCL26-01]
MLSLAEVFSDAAASSIITLHYWALTNSTSLVRWELPPGACDIKQ